MSNIMLEQVWLSTPIDYPSLTKKQQTGLIDALLDIQGVSEVEFYSTISLLCDISACSDAEAFCELAALRSKIQAVFESYKVWPETAASIYPKSE